MSTIEEQSSELTNQYKDVIKRCINRMIIAYIISKISYIINDTYHKSNLNIGSSYRRLYRINH